MFGKIYSRIPYKTLIRSLISGALSSCAIFVKYSDDIFHYNNSDSISKDWKNVSEDIGVAMYKLKELTNGK